MKVVLKEDMCKVIRNEIISFRIFRRYIHYVFYNILLAEGRP
jgi:hypothetical protein